MLNEILDKINIVIAIEAFDNTNISIDTNDKLPDHISLKDLIILTTCNIKGNDKYCSQLFVRKHYIIRCLFWLVESICITRHVNNIWWRTCKKKQDWFQKKYWMILIVKDWKMHWYT